MSYETRYAAAVRQRADNEASKPERVAERIAHRDAGRLAHSDMLAKYPTLTPENAQEAMDYQDARVQHWRKELCA